jgi:hypothetical protein
VGGGRICPAHLKMWLKGLQARDVGVAVEQLDGPERVIYYAHLPKSFSCNFSLLKV